MIAELARLATPQLRFLAACSYIPASEDGFIKQKKQLAGALDSGQRPDQLWAGIQRHRIFVLAERVLHEHHMQQALGEFLPALQASARQTRMQSLALLSASVQLSAALCQAGITHRFLKGPLLSQKIYGDAGLRHSKDLDLIVAPRQIAPAVRVLQANGWEFSDDATWLKGGIYRRIAECRHHLALRQPQWKIGLELHWRIELVLSPKLEEKWWSLWSVKGSDTIQAIREFAPAESLYLCLHGAMHAWGRLKWLGDLAAILERQPELWRDSRACADLRLDVVLAQTILLLRILFDIEPDAAAAAILRHEPRAYALAAFALREMKESQLSSKQSLRRSRAFRRYSAMVEARYSFRERFPYWLAFWLTHGGPILFHYRINNTL